ncbi:MAG: asparagine synthase-related protein [bacterium]
MSAIAGFMWLGGHDARGAELDLMLASLAHRGSEGSGAWIGGPVALGHLMRWSTPQSLLEALPFVTLERDVALTYDGRLDNRDELCATLGVPFRDRPTLGDGALMAHAYRQWGERCAEHMIGDFAFVLHDVRARRLLCAVDALGSIPLHYARPPGRFAFASEARALQALPGVPRRLNAARFADRGVIGLFSLDKEATFFEEIQVIPPGHTLIVRPEGLSLRCYWEPAQVPPTHLRTDDDFVDAMRERVTEAVRCRTRSAYPVASLLSGGLDSSVVALLAARELAADGRRLLTISSVLAESHDGPEHDEREHIARAAEHADVDWTGVAPHVDLFDTLDEEFFWNERPSAIRHDIYQGLYAAARAGHARTLLDGHGGELGMTAHGHDYLLHLLVRGRWPALARQLHAGSGVQDTSYARYAFRQLVGRYRTRRADRRNSTNEMLEACPLAPELITRYRMRERLDEAREERTRRLLAGAHHQRVVHAQRMQKPHEAQCDSFGVRAAFPFRDRRVIELSLHLPESLTRYRGYQRGLARRAFDGVIPPVIQWRRDKTAFSPDYFRRLRANRHRMRDELANVRGDDPIHGYLDLSKMRTTLDGLSGETDWSRGTPGSPGMTAASMLDVGLILLRYFRWCGATGTSMP